MIVLSRLCLIGIILFVGMGTVDAQTQNILVLFDKTGSMNSFHDPDGAGPCPATSRCDLSACVVRADLVFCPPMPVPDPAPICADCYGPASCAYPVDPTSLTPEFKVWNFSTALGTPATPGVDVLTPDWVGLTDFLTMIDVAAAEPCGGTTPLADALCQACDAFSGVSSFYKYVYVITDALENASSGACTGAPSSTYDPSNLFQPFDAGSWHQLVYDNMRLSGCRVIVDYYYSGVPAGPGVASGPSTIEFLTTLAEGTGGTVRLIPNGSPIPPVDPWPTTGEVFNRGDVNDDGSFDISDAVFALQSLFGGGTAFSCDDAADMNDDGDINVADPVAALATLFSAGPPLTDPFGVCGVDPTADSLDCAVYLSCP